MEIVPRSALFRQIPPVDELLRNQAVATLISSYGHEAVVGGCRLVLEQLRREIASGMNETALTQALVALPETVEATLRESSRPSLRPVINATGVILHTNLGRAPLAESALRHALEVARGYSNLEFDLERGERGRRDVHVERLFSELFVEIEPTRAQATATPPPEQNVDRVRTVIVNNNAAAVMLALNTLADGGEVIVSRGELVEIGGSFRIPDVMSKSGAILREVGTTNRTRIGDYERAINERTKLLLRVHRSNFKIIGFTEQPSVEELVALGRKCQIPVLEDLGSGALFPLEEIGISGEPTVFSSLRAGVDVITYSGDKLLGGPQAGILSGRAELIARIRSNPLFRALRVDKLIYSVLETTLLAYVRRQYDAVPALRMMRVSAQELYSRAESLASELRKNCPKLQAEAVASKSVVGGGAAPGSELPSYAVAIAIEGFGADELVARLRSNEPAIIARVEEGRVLFDLRTISPPEEGVILAALTWIVK